MDGDSARPRRVRSAAGIADAARRARDRYQCHVEVVQREHGGQGGRQRRAPRRPPCRGPTIDDVGPPIAHGASRELTHPDPEDAPSPALAPGPTAAVDSTWGSARDCPRSPRRSLRRGALEHPVLHADVPQRLGARGLLGVTGEMLSTSWPRSTSRRHRKYSRPRPPPPPGSKGSSGVRCRSRIVKARSPGSGRSPTCRPSSISSSGLSARNASNARLHAQSDSGLL